MASVFQNLEARGFVAQVTHPDLDELLGREALTLYAGFDPTADSLHVGHLLPVMALCHFQRAGHRVIALVGGATGMVGDPSGRSDERNLLTADEVARNAAALRDQLGRLLDFSGENAARMVNNADWIAPMSFIDWLRDVGKHFTINTMINKESVRKRLADERGLSYTEFSYQTMQAYDFRHLFDTLGCRLQIGGSDQWGNITAGMDLIHKTRGADAYGMTIPLLMTASGEKFGKSAGNAVWLDAARTSPYKFYQFWLQTEDADSERLLKFFSFLPLDRIAELVAEQAAAPEAGAARKALATEMTRLIHGEAGLATALRATQALFGGELDGLTDADLNDIFADVPSTSVPRAALEAGMPLLDLLVTTGLAASKGAGRRLVEGGGIYLNNRRAADPQAVIRPADLASQSVLVLRSGRRNYHLARFA